MKAKGIKELNKYKMGDKLTNRQAIIAKCADCMGLYVDGKLDCTIPDCPLYPLMPYGSIWKGRPKGKIPVGFVNTMHQKIKQGRNKTISSAYGPTLSTHPSLRGN
jgi:hypothetical protein